jgi:hypothetical protein
MKFMEGVSVLTVVMCFLSGIATYWILTFNWPFYAKALCVTLLVLSSLILFANDVDKMRVKESMKK